jgi:hypothetical protein
MIEYVLLLASTTGAYWVDRATRAMADDPVLVWGGAAGIVLLMVWVLKPSR